MYQKATFKETPVIINKCYEGETIEMKMDRVLNNKEPIKDGAPLVYTERKDGVPAAYNPRTDRWEIAVEATDKIAKSYQARRDDRVKMDNNKNPETGANTSQAGQAGTSSGTNS